ncbi:VOC family protein [Duganella aceris]|uniref:VOC family protein n=1 Tax=Duganella aceris TaxID=2703883 RepID=A0ABX0FT29_9BURK|nr:VOC family protein [Duganella aceris]NGZ87858.1 VOC family protein [Duganella aceris]
MKAVIHLNFRGQAREALGFYQSVFGGDVTLVTYKDAHKVTEQSEAEQIMWGQVAADDGFRVMAYDVPSHTAFNPGELAFLVVVEAATAEETSARWDKLSDGATITAPLAPSPWSPLYGMLKDRFGVNWVLSVATAYSEA